MSSLQKEEFMKKINKKSKVVPSVSKNFFSNEILLDNSVLYAIFDTKDVFHESAVKLSNLCNILNIKCSIPAHTFFEFTATRLRKINEGNIELALGE